MQVDLLIAHAEQVITCASEHGPKRAEAMTDVGLIPDGAVAVADSTIVAVGPTSEVEAEYQARQSLDANGKVVCPGFVDPHTHVVYDGDRLAEFEMRLKGASYMEIMAAGGGIVSTTREVRQASVAQLVAATRPRLDAMLKLGTTTVEVKTGYGLETQSELTMLKAIEALDQEHPADLVPTFLGAHAIPPEYQGRGDAYTELVIQEMLPRVASWYNTSSFAKRHWPCFIDVFCERGAFDLEQSRRVLQAGQALGLGVKIHVDEFTSLGGVQLAVELQATSTDHLDVTVTEDRKLLAQADTVGVVLPAVNVNLGSCHFADARALIDAGVALALATDMNPGSAPCPSMPLVMALACRYQNLLPAEAMHASTINAAHAVGLGNRLGSLEVGKQADLLIVNAPDYRHLAYQFGDNLVEHVIKRGRVVV
jgi:imidazolonepropionase